MPSAASPTPPKPPCTRVTEACLLRFYQPDGTTSLYRFSTKFEADGITFEEPNDQMFSFNSPIGACPECEGFRTCRGHRRTSRHPQPLPFRIRRRRGVLARRENGRMERHGDTRCGESRLPHFHPLLPVDRRTAPHAVGRNPLLRGYQCFLQNVAGKPVQDTIPRYAGALSRQNPCPKCHGTRLKPEAGYVRVGGRSISELVDLPITELKVFFDNLKLDKHDADIARRILIEINNRIRFLLDVGLGYLTLNRLSNSLSGGESQRINLATSLGSSLVGSLYILDEPSIGLHSRDTDKLIHVLRQLQQLGNTVVVVEHDEEIIRAADYIIDIGPKAGRLGGEVVYQGDMKDLQKNSNSYTVRYLLGEETIPVPESRRPWNQYIGNHRRPREQSERRGRTLSAQCNDRSHRRIGSGKSTLVRDIFFRALKRELDECTDRPGEFASISGDLRNLRNVEFVDQNPIGKSSRSNPVTYIKAYDEIRKLWAEQPLAKQMGYTAGHFSFNSEGGRCEECKGEGTITVEMQFMADLVLECESCHGKRFKADTLEVKYHDVNIYDVLEMTVNQAIEFFTGHGQKKIVKRLQPLQDVGLGYIKLGQSSSTLSGGENQRVKLAYYLSMEKADPTLFIFDEPTTGLHFHDIRKLLEAFDALIRRGHSIVIIEHNMDVVKCADHVIDPSAPKAETKAAISWQPVHRKKWRHVRQATQGSS